MPDTAAARPRYRLRDIEAMHEAAAPRSAAYRHFLPDSAQILPLVPVNAWRSSPKTAKPGRTTLEDMALHGPRILPALQRVLAAETWASTLLAAVGALALSGLTLLCGGCTEWVVVRPSTIEQATWDQSRVSYENGTVIELAKSRLAYPKLQGEITAVRDEAVPNPLRRFDVGSQTSIDLRLVKSVEVLQPAPQRTALLVTGILIGGAGLVTGFVFLGILFANGAAVGPTF